MADIQVRHERGDRFRIAVRGHEVIVDQPIGDGGEDTGPTPTELFVAGLASCIAFYAGRYLRRHGLRADGMGVECDFSFAADRPARVSHIDVNIVLPEAFPAERRPGLVSVVEHCTVHNSIRQPPEVAITLHSDERAPARSYG